MAVGGTFSARIVVVPLPRHIHVLDQKEFASHRHESYGVLAATQVEAGTGSILPSYPIHVLFSP